jgi:hypothetical protein
VAVPSLHIAPGFPETGRFPTRRGLPVVKLTITGVNLIVAAGLVAAIGNKRRFSSPQQLVILGFAAPGTGKQKAAPEGAALVEREG